MSTFPAAQESRTWPSSQASRVGPAAQPGRIFPDGPAPSVLPSKFTLYSHAHGGATTLSAGGVVNYEPPTGSEYGGPSGQWTSEAPHQQTAPIAVTLSLLQSIIYNNTTSGGATATLRSRINGANGNQVTTVAAGSLVRGTDTTHTDDVAIGGKFCTSVQVAAGAGVYTAGGSRMVMQPTTDNTKHWALYGGHGAGGVSAGATAAWSPTAYGSGDPAGDRNEAFTIWYCDATIEQFRFYVGTNTLSVSTTFQLYKNGVAVSGATKAVSAGATGEFFLDGLGAVTLTSGDQVNLRTVIPAGTGTISVYRVDMWTSTTRTLPKAMMTAQHVSGGVINTTSVRYGALCGSVQTAEALEERVSISHGFAGKSSGMTIRVTSNPAGTCTMRYRVGGANGNQVLTVTSAGTGIFRDTTNTDTFAAADECSYSFTRSSSTNFIYTHCLTVEEYVSG